MKAGSLVECIVSLSVDQADFMFRPHIKQLPVKNSIYTVREIKLSPVKSEGLIVYLEEICMGHNPNTHIELGLDPNCFRELIIPPNLEEEISEALTRELVEV